MFFMVLSGSHPPICLLANLVAGCKFRAEGEEYTRMHKLGPTGGEERKL